MSSNVKATNRLSVREAIRAKRAVRNYQDAPVPANIVEAILDAGRRAQSSKNDQPWTFVVVRERAQLQRLSRAGSYAAHMATSAWIVVLVAPKGYEFDLGQAAAYMQLVAVEHAVGSCVTVLHDHAAARAILGVPEDLTCYWTITFGYPVEVPTPLKIGGRRPLDALVRYERYS
jgi:nitroreductase